MGRFGFVLSLCFVFGFSLEIKSIYAQFTQYSASNQDSIRYYGDLFAKDTNSVKWVYKIPMQKTIFIKNDILISYEPNLNQAIYKRLQKHIDFISIINGAKQDPKNKNLYISKVDNVEYRLYMIDGVPHKIEFLDELDNPMIIEFKNVVINGDIKDLVFDFVPPEGIDIIKD